MPPVPATFLRYAIVPVRELRYTFLGTPRTTTVPLVAFQQEAAGAAFLRPALVFFFFAGDLAVFFLPPSYIFCMFCISVYPLGANKIQLLSYRG